MHEKDNYLKTAELSTEQNCTMIDGVPNNTPIQPAPPELDVLLLVFVLLFFVFCLGCVLER